MGFIKNIPKDSPRKHTNTITISKAPNNSATSTQSTMERNIMPPAAEKSITGIKWTNDHIIVPPHPDSIPGIKTYLERILRSPVPISPRFKRQIQAVLTDCNNTLRLRQTDASIPTRTKLIRDGLRLVENDIFDDLRYLEEREAWQAMATAQLLAQYGEETSELLRMFWERGTKHGVKVGMGGRNWMNVLRVMEDEERLGFRARPILAVLKDIAFSTGIHFLAVKNMIRRHVRHSHEQYASIIQRRDWHALAKRLFKDFERLDKVLPQWFQDKRPEVEEVLIRLSKGVFKTYLVFMKDPKRPPWVEYAAREDILVQLPSDVFPGNLLPPNVQDLNVRPCKGVPSNHISSNGPRGNDLHQDVQLGTHAPQNLQVGTYLPQHVQPGSYLKTYAPPDSIEPGRRKKTIRKQGGSLGRGSDSGRLDNMKILERNNALPPRNHAKMRGSSKGYSSTRDDMKRQGIHNTFPRLNRQTNTSPQTNQGSRRESSTASGRSRGNMRRLGINNALPHLSRQNNTLPRMGQGIMRQEMRDFLPQMSQDSIGRPSENSLPRLTQQNNGILQMNQDGMERPAEGSS